MWIALVYSFDKNLLKKELKIEKWTDIEKYY
jgi:hypothetical protein